MGLFLFGYTVYASCILISVYTLWVETIIQWASQKLSFVVLFLPILSMINDQWSMINYQWSIWEQRQSTLIWCTAHHKNTRAHIKSGHIACIRSKYKYNRIHCKCIVCFLLSLWSHPGVYWLVCFYVFVSQCSLLCSWVAQRSKALHC
jgi:hypothetical protein